MILGVGHKQKDDCTNCIGSLSTTLKKQASEDYVCSYPLNFTIKTEGEFVMMLSHCSTLNI